MTFIIMILYRKIFVMWCITCTDCVLCGRWDWVKMRERENHLIARKFSLQNGKKIKQIYFECLWHMALHYVNNCLLFVYVETRHLCFVYSFPREYLVLLFCFSSTPSFIYIYIYFFRVIPISFRTHRFYTYSQ